MSDSDGDDVEYKYMDIPFAKPNHSKSHREKNKLGTINGCYIPCLLNIMGIILFERLGWGIGHIGISGVLIIFLISEIQAIITVLSLSALISNSKIRGGGLYYLISRSLGPEFGGSIGILFYAAYCVGVAFYCSGFAERIVNTFSFDEDNTYNTQWLTIGIASVVLLLCLIISLMGAQCFTKINTALFLFQFLGIIIALTSLFYRGTFSLQHDHEFSQEQVQETNSNMHAVDDYLDRDILQCMTDNKPDGPFKHFEWSYERFWNIWSLDNCSSCGSFVTIFGVLFPATTGIMEGANLSGDLENPIRSIPIGTLSAIGTSIVFYILLIIGFAGSFNPCTLRQDTDILQESAFTQFLSYLVVLSIIISASSSAIGSLFGGSRVLQAIARDKLFPYTRIFEYGTPIGDEPNNAVIITWLIAQLLLFLGGIDDIAPISTSFFCLSYAAVNVSCFMLAKSGRKTFRPTFQCYSWKISLFGAVCSLAIMFYVDYQLALVTFFIEIGIFIYLTFRVESTYTNMWQEHRINGGLMCKNISKYWTRWNLSDKDKKSNMLDLIRNSKN